MNQFGMEIPAAEGSALPLFDGDLRGHRRRAVHRAVPLHVLRAREEPRRHRAAAPARGPSCCWTSWARAPIPQEGVALAMALLDHFHGAGCIVMATTHHGILKNYGATRPGAQNASMGFDRETLAPDLPHPHGRAGRKPCAGDRAAERHAGERPGERLLLPRRRADRHFAAGLQPRRAPPEARGGRGGAQGARARAAREEAQRRT